VPTFNVSLAILNLVLGQSVGRDEVNAYLRGVATTGTLGAQVGWTSMPDTVSSDLVGDTHAGVVDSQATIATEEGVVLYVWYDNEFGYSCQVMRMLERLCGVHRRVFP
jgi:glyceraldehyde 3-phosphate dehydrogenase